MVDRLAPTPSASSATPNGRPKLDAAVAASGWRELRSPTEGTSPLASGVEAAIVAEELGRGLADVAFFGPTLAARAAAGWPVLRPRCATETVAFVPDLSLGGLH